MFRQIPLERPLYLPVVPPQPLWNASLKFVQSLREPSGIMNRGGGEIVLLWLAGDPPSEANIIATAVMALHVHPDIPPSRRRPVKV